MHVWVCVCVCVCVSVLVDDDVFSHRSTALNLLSCLDGDEIQHVCLSWLIQQALHFLKPTVSHSSCREEGGSAALNLKHILKATWGMRVNVYLADILSDKQNNIVSPNVRRLTQQHLKWLYVVSQGIVLSFGQKIKRSKLCFSAVPSDYGAALKSSFIPQNSAINKAFILWLMWLWVWMCLNLIRWQALKTTLIMVQK